MTNPLFLTPISVWWTNYYSNSIPYHNANHIRSFDILKFASVEGKIAMLMHDAWYDPFSDKNEEKACEAVDHLVENIFRNAGEKISFDVERVKHIIMSTKDHVANFDSKDADVVELHRQDLKCFHDYSVDIHRVGMQIFREYAFVKFSEFKEKRIKILENFKNHPLCDEKRIDDVIKHLKNFRPKIGIFAGSFQPFHVGHMDILNRAKPLFDKIIVAQGQNPEKPENKYSIFDVRMIKNDCTIQCEQYSGTVFDFIKEQKEGNCQITMIRGLRDSNDLIYERNMQRVLKDFAHVNCINILSDEKISHVSSSLVRELDKLKVAHSFHA